MKQLPLWAKIALSALLFIGIGVGSAVLLRATLGANHQKVSNSSTSEQTVNISAKSILTAIEDKADEYIITAGYKQNTESATNNYIYGALKPSTYALTIPTMQHVQYSRIDDTITDNDAAALEHYYQLLNELGLTQVSSTSTPGIESRLYMHASVTCQTEAHQLIGSRSANFGVSCADASDIANIYNQTDDLLKMATSDLSMATITSISQSTITSEDKQLRIFVIETTDGASKTAYYLATKNNTGWEYIGLRSTPSVDDESSFIVPQKLKDTVNASSEKSFLLQFIAI